MRPHFGVLARIAAIEAGTPAPSTADSVDMDIAIEHELAAAGLGDDADELRALAAVAGGSTPDDTWDEEVS